MSTMVAEVLAAWRDAERVLEAYKARPERDRATEERLRTAVASLRYRYQALTSSAIPSTHHSLYASRRLIADTKALLRRLTEAAPPDA